jgi:hypothetical protein
MYEAKWNSKVDWISDEEIVGVLDRQPTKGSTRSG